NGTNILLDFVFVVGLGWGVAGVAWATVVAEVLALVVGCLVVLRHIRTQSPRLGISRSKLLDRAANATLFSVNRDIMIRTLCLIFAFAWFTNEGVKSGDLLLAANAIRMQFVSFSAFFLDGFALAGEALVGSAVGARNRRLLMTTLRHITELGFATSLLVAGILFTAGPWAIDLLTNVDEVRAASRAYLVWAVMAPPVSLWCYLLDGVFIGATGTAEMRNAMILSLAVYLVVLPLLTAMFGNHGLWLSLHIYFVARALALAAYLPRIIYKTG
ncbi:MAG: MATE family efflux transporter, partial [Pseudomonadales bacterium]